MGSMQTPTFSLVVRKESNVGITVTSDPELGRLRAELHILENDREFAARFKRLMKLMHDIAVYKDWWNPPKTFGEQCMMMVTEIAEVVEEYRHEHGDVNKIYFTEQKPIEDNTCFSTITISVPMKPEGVPIEFADLTIREMDTCGQENIDLLAAIFMKASFNLNRPSRHGNKKL